MSEAQMQPCGFEFIKEYLNSIPVGQEKADRIWNVIEFAALASTLSHVRYETTTESAYMEMDDNVIQGEEEHIIQGTIQVLEETIRFIKEERIKYQR